MMNLNHNFNLNYRSKISLLASFLSKVCFFRNSTNFDDENIETVHESKQMNWKRFPSRIENSCSQIYKQEKASEVTEPESLKQECK